MEIEFPEKYLGLFDDYRYKVYYSGRGAGKTEQVAVYLLLKSLESKRTILCCREFQTSIKNSVHAVLTNAINRLGIGHLFKITNDSIVSSVGSNFIFAGLHNNIDNIKSIPNIKHCWCEESQSLSSHTLKVLLPTIRADGSEIIFTFNPYLDSDPVYQKFVVNTPDNALVVKTGWEDNPWFPEVLKIEMEADRDRDVEHWEHVWQGETVRHSDAIIFNRKYYCEPVKPQREWYGPYYGVDWGFASDPTVMVKCWVYDNDLYIEKETVGKHIDTVNLPKFFLDNDPNCNMYESRADCSRPETISHMRRNGFGRLTGCKKWSGSVEDGVSFLRGFNRIIIDPSCTEMLLEARMYRYKTDKLSGDVLPIIVDAYNHCWDAVRYALEPMIVQRRPGTVRVRNN